MKGGSIPSEYQELYDQATVAAIAGGSSEFLELYERAREATQEAQRQGDAQLKAAMAAAASVRDNPIHISPLSLTFSNTGLERAYWRQLASSIDDKDTVIYAVQFLVRIALLTLLLQTPPGQITSAKVGLSYVHWSSFFAMLPSCLWVAGLCTAVLVIQLWCSCWFQCNRGTILLIAAASLWVGEGVTVLASCPKSTHGLIVTLIQSTFMGVLHRVPFCFHLKTRAVGFGLQLSGALLRVRSDEAFLALLSVSMGHSLGIALAYILDQQSRAGFLRSSPQFVMEQILGGDFYQKPRRRALGGFAGGFAGVSSLKGSRSPAASMVFSAKSISKFSSWS